MRQARQHKSLRGRRRMRLRRIALIFSLFALLANQALLPIIHAAGGPPVPAPTSISHSAPSAGHSHEPPEQKGSREPSGAGHQVCHFCRLIGVALPPPPMTLLEVVSTSHAIGWIFADKVEPARGALSDRPSRPRTTADRLIRNRADQASRPVLETRPMEQSHEDEVERPLRRGVVRCEWSSPCPRDA
jgi:hypothetical protein